MGVKLFTYVSIGMVIAGMAALTAFLLHASVFAVNSDVNFGFRGSLGASLSDLSLDTGGGIWAFMLNAGFALSFLFGAHRMARGTSREPGPPRGRFAGAGGTLRFA